jgi:hypothetical protein
MRVRAPDASHECVKSRGLRVFREFFGNRRMKVNVCANVSIISDSDSSLCCQRTCNDSFITLFNYHLNIHLYHYLYQASSGSTMAALQSFQAEIEDIRNRELAKARAQSQPEAPRKGHIDQRSAPKARKKTAGGETPVTSVIPKVVNDESAQELTDIEHSIEARYTYTPPSCHSFSLILYCIECATVSNWRRYSGKRSNSDTSNATWRRVSASTGCSPTKGTVIC